jgi:hypothetical protein
LVQIARLIDDEIKIFAFYDLQNRSAVGNPTCELTGSLALQDLRDQCWPQVGARFVLSLVLRIPAGCQVPSAIKVATPASTNSIGTPGPARSAPRAVVMEDHRR